jgi:hypothetical protein
MTQWACCYGLVVSGSKRFSQVLGGGCGVLLVLLLDRVQLHSVTCSYSTG